MELIIRKLEQFKFQKYLVSKVRYCIFSCKTQCIVFVPKMGEILRRSKSLALSVHDITRATPLC